MICPHTHLGMLWRGHQVVYCKRCGMPEPFQPQIVTGIERHWAEEAKEVKELEEMYK